MNCTAIISSGRKNAFHLISCKNCAVSTKGIRHELQYPFSLSVGRVVGIEVRRVVIANAGTAGGLGVGKGEESEQERRNGAHFMHTRSGLFPQIGRGASFELVGLRPGNARVKSLVKRQVVSMEAKRESVAVRVGCIQPKKAQREWNDLP